MNKLEELQAFFKNDIFATQAGIVIERVDDDYVICSLALHDGHMNAVGHVQGGLIFTLADFAFAVISNKHRIGTVTLSSTIQFLSAPKGSILSAKAICIREGRSISNYRIQVSDNAGVQVAEVLVTGFRK